MQGHKEKRCGLHGLVTEAGLCYFPQNPAKASELRKQRGRRQESSGYTGRLPGGRHRPHAGRRVSRSDSESRIPARSDALPAPKMMLSRSGSSQTRATAIKLRADPLGILLVRIARRLVLLILCHLLINEVSQARRFGPTLA